MVATLMERPKMAQQRGRPAKPGGEGKPVRIDQDLASKAKIVAMRLDVPLSDYLSEIIKARVLKDFAKVMAEAGGE